MSAGSLLTAIDFDDPDRIYYGNERPVTGNVLLKFRPSVIGDTSQEFFGPLTVRITFHGRAKSKVMRKTSNGTSTYRGRVPLFSKTIKIFDDSAKIAVGEVWPVPFEISFPDGFALPASDYDNDQRFDCSKDQPLPPSFKNEYSGFTNHYDSFVEYRIGASVTVPHIPVSVVATGREPEPLLHYQQPRPPRAIEPKHYYKIHRVNISNEHLLPEEDRPSGFRQKAKAALSSDFWPHYVFDWHLIAPQHIYLGRPIAFEMRVRVKEDASTAVVTPEIKLKRFVVKLVENTVVRAEKEFISNHEASHEEPIKTFNGVVDNSGPFCKAKDWTKTVKTASLPAEITPTFKTVNISHTYVMIVDMSLGLAGEMATREWNVPIVLLPPVWDDTAATGGSYSSAAPGPSNPPAVTQQVDEPLPRYEEGLPEYDEAIAAQSDPPPKSE